MKRKISKKKIILLSVLVFFGILSVDAFLIEPNMIDVRTLDIESTGNDMKIVFIADFQRGNNDPLFVQRVVNIVNKQKPDLVLMGGDYVDRSSSELPSVAPLRKMEAKHGTYAVMGNHDYRTSWSIPDATIPQLDMSSEIIRFLEDDSSIRFLSNDIVIIENTTVIGLDSYWGMMRNESAALEKPSTGYKIFLAHNQDDLYITKEKADLYLFGHTQCGQVRLPFIGSVPKLFGFKGEHDYGYYFVNGTHLYATCGLAPAPRFLNPNEITVINLS